MKNEITYPHAWEWRLIVEYKFLPSAINEVNQILSAFDQQAETSTGSLSANKKYCAININAVVQSSEMVEQIAKALSKVSGYKVLL